ncbi:hypothetical protein SAMN06269185_0074 [Natronoarchaeum philippinense]|uniref:Archaeal Type IV pilin N-terminal domain-containing protein n=1 Tax=Natronoarchaeum philippinense TaxID=558529 RepID=A0A285N3T0_NATPI|nr:hypothetical protein [Natronoarchaeum philippinense]SNZ02646.1 hypothetical protein SAMN06269185_0074 [Natronoarchaeum philippinense]
MVSIDPQRSDESLPFSTAQFIGIVVALIVLGLVVGFAAFALLGNAEERPNADFEFEQYGASEQQVAITNLSGERIENPSAVVVEVDGERIQNNTGHDWKHSDGGIGPDSAVYIGYNDSQGTILVSDRDDPSLQRGLPPDTEIRVLWFSQNSDSSGELDSYVVELREG